MTEDQKRAAAQFIASGAAEAIMARVMREIIEEWQNSTQAGGVEQREDLHKMLRLAKSFLSQVRMSELNNG